MQKIMPEILDVKNIAKSRLFNIEQVDLKFSNGNLRSFERLKSGTRSAVIIAAMLDLDTVLLIKEYAVGTERYELGLPKGLVELGESLVDAANRELQEEIGYAARQFEHLTSLTLAPNYMAHSSELIIARNLYANKLDGDEPETLEVVPYNLKELDQLILTGKITEARSIAGLYIVKNYLNNIVI